MPEWREVDENQLIQQAKDGIAEAFGELYERHLQAIFHFLFARLNNRHDAEDLAEDVFVKAYNSLPSYHERGIPFRAFLLRIARNSLIDHYRRNGYSPRHVSIEDVQLHDRESNPVDIAGSKLDHKELREVLEQLRDDYQEVLVLRFVNDLSTKETAKIMKRSTGAVRVLQHRALASMQKLLEVAGWNL
jgi:RNA polymerase sigma-70 factor (ECF subfamily)